MVNRVKNVLDRKQKTSLFGIIRRNIYAKEDVRSATKFPDYIPIEAVKDCQMRAEQEKARAAVELLLRKRQLLSSII